MTTDSLFIFLLFFFVKYFENHSREDFIYDLACCVYAKLLSIGGCYMNRQFFEMVEANPIIAAVKDSEGLERCCSLEDIKVVFILFGDICTISGIVKRIKEAGKTAVVHIDLIGGLNAKEIAVDFIRDHTQADGIISTKPTLIRRAKELSMYTVLRYFLIDSMALENIRQQQYGVRPDFLEVLPGVMPRIIGKICQSSKVPIIAGGLISDKESALAALSAGAVAVSTTNTDVWVM